jgi:spore coat polysaccharide biosynthesis protein SpsF
MQLVNGDGRAASRRFIAGAVTVTPRNPGDSVMPRIVASIEARMGSSRLPGKVLSDIRGRPALTRLLYRLRRARHVDDIILATTESPIDDALEAWAAREGVMVHRGSEDDVLQRVVEAQRRMDSEIVVEVTGDCVLLDPEVIDWGVEMFLENDCDVVTNVRKPSFPMGVDVQVFRLRDLEEVAAAIDDPAVHEHVSLYFYEHPERYRVLHLLAPNRWQGPEYRFQLDHPQDREFIARIYEALEPVHGEGFGLEEVMTLLRRQPHLLETNRECEERAVRP